MIKKLDLYVYSFQKWVYIKDILIKLNVCILWQKMKRFSDKYMTIWGKVSNITKKINSELIYNKKYQKAEKRFNTKESF